MLGGARVGGGLERRLVRAQTRFLVDLGAGVPEQNLRGDVAGDRLAAGVEQGDAFLPGSVEQVVGLLNIAAIVSRSPGFALTLNSKASPGQMSPGLRAPTGVSVEPTWTMPGWPFRDFSSGPVGPSSARASSPLPRSGSPDVNSGARLV